MIPEAETHLIRSELRKLASLPEGTRLTVESVGQLVGVRHGETLWDWRDAVFDGDIGRAARLLPPVLAQSGVSGVKLVTAIGTALVGIGIARAHYDRGVRGGALGAAIMKTLLSVRPCGLLSYREEADRWSRWAPPPSCRGRTARRRTPTRPSPSPRCRPRSSPLSRRTGCPAGCSRTSPASAGGATPS